MSASNQSPASSNLIRLTAELVMTVASYLPNRDIKNLRLTCRILRERAPLRLDRVFLSANPRNIEVFRAIADHETFHKGVVEIIWDDAQLVSDIPRQHDEIYLLMGTSPPPPEGCPRWFARACRKNIEALGSRKRDRELPFEVSWNYYQQLLLQQEDVLASGADANALSYGLEHFPSLRRITITPAAHGFLDIPLYETPMIRSFPHGFNYPIPRSWPLHDLGRAPYEVLPWNYEEEKSKWRGFCIVTRELANQDHHVSELVLDVNQLNTGLSCRVFDQPCEEYNNLVTLLRRSSFSRIDLALLADGQYYDGEDWSSFRSGYLKGALGEATDLLHVSLCTQIDYDQVYEIGLPPDAQFAKHLIPLRTIFPIDKWQRLQHFGLSNFLVRQDDLLSLLAALPTTLQSIELSFLKFSGGNYCDLLLNMRNTLGWRERAIGERPMVTIRVETHFKWPIRYLWMDDEVNEFLYGDGTNPFSKGGFGNHPLPNKGIERDPFEPR